ncbi:MAG TPA: methyltransferase domain-containing protein [Acidimicrobiales bacterium]|nr:methyltransferase domain-containing protein [Acidimicrobiales bacterium]
MTPGHGLRDEVPAGVLDTQLAYYRARAPEYDEWFHRHGRYDRGADQTAAWHAELGVVRSWLGALDLDGLEVLELAPGTGLWTAELLDAGASVTAVDAAPEMLEALRRRCAGPRLTTVLADLFSWAPARRFDAVVACFFMSHVPDERFAAFLELVAGAVGAGGRCFLLDGVREASSTARDHVLGAERAQTMQRRLDDGRTYEIVKVFRGDEELSSACARAGLDVDVRRTATYFQVADGRRT